VSKEWEISEVCVSTVCPYLFTPPPRQRDLSLVSIFVSRLCPCQPYIFCVAFLGLSFSVARNTVHKSCVVCLAFLHRLLNTTNTTPGSFLLL